MIDTLPVKKELSSLSSQADSLRMQTSGRYQFGCIIWQRSDCKWQSMSNLWRAPGSLHERCHCMCTVLITLEILQSPSIRVSATCKFMLSQHFPLFCIFFLQSCHRVLASQLSSPHIHLASLKKSKIPMITLAYWPLLDRCITQDLYEIREHMSLCLDHRRPGSGHRSPA